MAKKKRKAKGKKDSQTEALPKLEEIISSELDALIDEKKKYSDAIDDATKNQLMKQIENKLVRAVSPDPSQVRDLFNKIKMGK